MSQGFSRGMKATAAVTIGLFAVTACGGGGGEDGDVELSMYWWGSDSRHQNTQELIDIYEEQNPGVTISPTYSDWSGYWDRLNTQAAGRDLPDVIQMDALYIREYGENGVLLDLADMEFDHLNEGVRDSGATESGVWGMPVGITVMALAANIELFEEAGLELPDDTSWDWDDLEEVAAELSANTEGYGLTALNESAGLELWLRQHGKAMLTEDGQLGFEPADAAAYFEKQLEMLESGGMPPASQIVEDQAPGSVDQSLTGQGEAAMGMWWDTQLGPLAEQAEVGFQPLRMPSIDGDGNHELFFKPSMFYSGAADTEHPEEVKDFIDFLVNSEESADINQTDRGLPANEDSFDRILPELNEQQTVIAEFADEVGDELGAPATIPPEGTSAFPSFIYRYTAEVLFEDLSPEQAAEQLYGEMENELN